MANAILFGDCFASLKSKVICLQRILPEKDTHLQAICKTYFDDEDLNLTDYQDCQEPYWPTYISFFEYSVEAYYYPL